MECTFILIYNLNLCFYDFGVQLSQDCQDQWWRNWKLSWAPCFMCGQSRQMDQPKSLHLYNKYTPRQYVVSIISENLLSPNGEKLLSCNRDWSLKPRGTWAQDSALRADRGLVCDTWSETPAPAPSHPRAVRAQSAPDQPRTLTSVTYTASNNVSVFPFGASSNDWIKCEVRSTQQ